MIPKQYLLSDEFDYSRTIAADVGPRYAANMGWSTAPLSSAPAHPDAVLVVDNRITEQECLFVEQHIATRKNVVVLKIVDPFEEYCRNHWYYRFLFRVRQAPNVYFLSTYRPSEVVEDLDRLTERKKLVFVPYAFRDTLNLAPDHWSRFPGVILPGALSKSIYPFRYAFARHLRWHPIQRRRVKFLKHPGYPDLGHPLRHQLLGRQFLERLAAFRFMFHCPTRADVELLKYAECAYARCVPVGKPPGSFSERMRRPFVEFDFGDLSGSLRRALSIPEPEVVQRSAEYYDAMAAERNPNVLNRQLDAFLAAIV